MSRRRKTALTARTADKYELYQWSVQGPSIARFLARRYRNLTGRPLRMLREDFCGTAFNCCEFVKLHPHNHAIGVDLDESALRWCLAHNFPKLTESQWDRITLIKGNVLTVKTRKADLIAALNYSYSIFRERKELLSYLLSVRKSLKKNGVFIVDAHGGKDVGNRQIRDFGDFTYVCDEEAFDPITHHVRLRMHFTFPNGSSIRNAFGYDFRLWALPELQDLFREAGFKNVHVLWLGADRDTNLSNGIFKRTARTSYSFSLWIAYVLGQA